MTCSSVSPSSIERFDLIADDREHVAVVADVRGVAEPAVARDDHRAAFGAELRDRELQDCVEPVEHAVDAAAGFDVDDRKRVHVERGRRPR